MGNAESKKNNAVSPDSRDSRSLLRSDIFHDQKAINEHIKAINRVIQNPETQIGFLKIMMAEGIPEYKILQGEPLLECDVDRKQVDECAKLVVSSLSNYVGGLTTVEPSFQAFVSALQKGDAASTVLLSSKILRKYKSRSAQRRSENVPSSGSESAVSVMRQAMTSLNKPLVDRFCSSESWLESFTIAVEQLPICISIANADGARRGFPLIYVNSHFEQVTGYRRYEVLSKNCKFLQGTGVTEPESVQRISYALKNAQPIKVSITNVRKDGTHFKNLLSLKPIFDNTGKFRYVVGTQFDVSQPDATPAKLQLIDEVMRMIPTVIPTLDELPMSPNTSGK